jgi:hypothetical protein
MARARNNAPEFIKLEQRLVLLAWLNRLLGFETNRDLLADMRESAEGFDADGRSHIYHRLYSRGDRVKVSIADLARYDDNIRMHLAEMNARRPEPITLRYFQYLAALYAEIFLDRLFNQRATLLRDLNAFVDFRNTGRSAAEPPDARFSDSDLKKLAFWMATGSGKTLILHLNYRQFLHYNTTPLDNILLVTPNEGLSDQHMDEMGASNIPCRRFDLNETGLAMAEENTVRIIEITKLVEEKRGGGLSVPVEAFEGNNLIFVDEGHKGSGGDVWRKFRDALGQTGFTFEYSATFGQALTAAGNDELTAEYGKAIAFDYSYRYFHGDGFGKDFHILNLQQVTTGQETEILLLGNLLSFYEQQRVFQDHGTELHRYNLEKPLWIFVGHSVKNPKSNASQDDKRTSSDVLTITRFLHHVLENKRGWVTADIKKLLNGKSGLKVEDRDLFEDRFQYLRAREIDAEAIYRDILGKIFHAPASGALHLCDLRGSPGELALRASSSEDYFGLIYIGDTSTFKQLVEEDSEIAVEEDAIRGSLFEKIKEPDTTVEVLIGAKKFMEGWNSWRVSNMGLVNIGRREGSEIIQLFGRGVRLRGIDYSLKRSTALTGNHPKYVPLLETLNIFAVRANYMATFRDYLEREGIETLGRIDLPLAIRTNNDFLDRGLVVPTIPPNRSFADEADILLGLDPAIRVRVDMSLKVQAFESGSETLTATAARAGREMAIPTSRLSLIDWQQVWLDLLEYKERKSLHNLSIHPQTPRAILAHSEPSRVYTLVCDDSVVNPRSFAAASRLREAVLTILRKYVDKFYRVQQERWYSRNMSYKPLDRSDANFQDYRVQIAKTDVALIAEITKLIEEADRIYRDDLTNLPTIHFDHHLYQPLLVERGDNKVRSIPPGLKKSEKQFVNDLREFCRAGRAGALADAEVFLLRNLSRGKGIGFFETRGFYPDFILWIKRADAQRIVFVEPHGMIHENAFQHDDAANLHERLSSLSDEIRIRTGARDVTLDSFIVSATPFDTLRTRYEDGSWDRTRFAAAHIVFPERSGTNDYLRLIFQE